MHFFHYKIMGASKKFKNQPRPLLRPRSVFFCQNFLYLSLEAVPLKLAFTPVRTGSGGQISTKHQNTSIKPFFATCRLPQNPEFWRCYRPRHTFLGPHWKRSLKSLDTLLTVTTPNTQLLPRGRKMLLSS